MQEVVVVQFLNGFTAQHPVSSRIVIVFFYRVPTLHILVEITSLACIAISVFRLFTFALTDPSLPAVVFHGHSVQSGRLLLLFNDKSGLGRI